MRSSRAVQPRSRRRAFDTGIRSDVRLSTSTTQIRPGSATAISDPSRDHSNSFCSHPFWTRWNRDRLAEAASAIKSSRSTRNATCVPEGDHSGQAIGPGPARGLTRTIGDDASPRSFTPTTTTARSATDALPRRGLSPGWGEARPSPYASLPPSGENLGHAWAIPSPSEPIMRRAAPPARHRCRQPLRQTRWDSRRRQ